MLLQSAGRLLGIWSHWSNAGQVGAAPEGPNPRGSGEGWVESDQLGGQGRQGAGREMGKGLGGVRHLGGVWGGAVQEVGEGRWLEST